MSARKQERQKHALRSACRNVFHGNHDIRQAARTLLAKALGGQPWTSCPECNGWGVMKGEPCQICLEHNKAGA